MSLIAGNLGVVQRLLDGNSVVWGVCAGAAAHVYGNRRPIQDVDIVVAKGTLPTVVQLLNSSGKAVQFDGQRILWRGIKVFDDLTVRRTEGTHPLLMDVPMQAHLQRHPLLGSRVLLMAPEDVLVHKLVLGRGQRDGKHDIEDAAGIVRRQQLDAAYLAKRLELTKAPARVHEQLRELGVMVEAV